MPRWSTTLSRAGLAAVVALALLAAGCGSGSRNGGDTFVPGASSPSDQGASGTTAPAAGGPKASKATPLAERVFQVKPAPKTAAQREVLQVLQSYLDTVIVAFATNDVPGSGMRRYVDASVYQSARRQVADQAKRGYVVYGPYTFSIDPSEVNPPVAVAVVCVNQSRTRRHNAKTDAVGKPNDSPHVRLRYDLNFRPGKGWQVTGIHGESVSSCPG